MKAEQELFQAYREWLRLALAGHRAIMAHNWSLLSDCHQAIVDFQTQIAALLSEARSEWIRTGCNLDEKERKLQVCVSQVTNATRQNQALLQTTLTSARQHMGQMSESGRNLKRLRQSYGMVALQTSVL